MTERCEWIFLQCISIGAKPTLIYSKLKAFCLCLNSPFCNEMIVYIYGHIFFVWRIVAVFFVLIVVFQIKRKLCESLSICGHGFSSWRAVVAFFILIVTVKIRHGAFVKSSPYDNIASLVGDQ